MAKENKNKIFNYQAADSKQEIVSITYEEIGFFPRSFSRVLDRFLKQVFSDVENLVIQEYRFYRYLFLTTLKCLLILFFVPFLVNFFSKNYLVRPLTEYFWNTQQSEIFLNSYQQKRAFAELKNFEEKIYFESLINLKDISLSGPVEAASDFSNQNSLGVGSFEKKSLSIESGSTSLKGLKNSYNSNLSENSGSYAVGAFDKNMELGGNFGTTFIPEISQKGGLKGVYYIDGIDSSTVGCSANGGLLRQRKGCFANDGLLRQRKGWSANAKAKISSKDIKPNSSEVDFKVDNNSKDGVEFKGPNGANAAQVRAYAALPDGFQSKRKGVEVKLNDALTQKATKRDSFEQKLQEKTIELALRYNNQSIEAITNFFADLISFITLCYLLFALEIQINITKSFLLEVFFGLDDSKKSLLILLITDLLVGYHSSNLWELFFEYLFTHYGLPESQTGIFLLVATLPVLLDVLFKYLIFRHLNRSSPATVATYHAMIE